MEDEGADNETEEAAAASEAGSEPQAPPSVFINHIDTFFGSNLVKRFASPYRVVGTLRDAPVPAQDPQSQITIVPNDLPSVIAACMASDIIIFDISQQWEQAKAVVQSLQEANYEGQKTFVCVSTVMTWSATKTDAEDPDLPFAEDDYRRRVPHVNYKKHLFAEKFVLRVKKESLRTFVICSGVQYGAGEDVFHFLFKSAWLGTPPALYCITKGEAENIVPTIHITDLCSIVKKVAESGRPEDKYILAVDDGNCTLKDIVQAISNHLGTGKIQNISPEEALLIEGFSQRELDMLQVHLRTEAVLAKEMITWQSESGIVENIEAVTAEYRNTRGLTPIKIMIQGPPASGKTALSAIIAKHYSIHHLLVADVCKEILESDAELASEVNEARDAETGRINDEQLCRIYSRKLNGWQCQNQGFVMDGFPKNENQATLLLQSDGSEADETSTVESLQPSNQKIIPQHVFVLEAPDEFLRQRIINLPEAVVAGTHNTQEGFLRRLAKYHEDNADDHGVLQFMDRASVLPIPLDARRPLEELLKEIVREVGAPHRYGPTQEELEAQRREQEAIEQELKTKQELELKRRREEEAQRKEAQAKEWRLRMEEIRRQEREQLHAQSMPFRQYLMDNILPTLSAGLIEVAQVRPTDPIDYLAEYLFRQAEQ